MNEDYLWDKTGEDPQIEKLENALAVFRYKETSAPELPAKILPFKQKENAPRNFFRYAFAATACIAFAALSLGVRLQLSNTKIAGAIASVENIAPPIRVKPLEETTVKKVEVTNIGNIETAKQVTARKTVKIRKFVSQTVARKTKPVKETELTNEEKYAYDQLMLALSITSSKLKLVRDKVDGVEKQTVVETDGR